jgi:hypothetical protein
MFTCTTCNASIDPGDNDQIAFTAVCDHAYHKGHYPDVCYICDRQVACPTCHEPYTAIPPGDHDQVVFTNAQYQTWVTQAAINAGFTGNDDEWSQHVNETSKVADEFQDLLENNNCFPKDRPGGHYFQQFNNDYLGGRGDLYHS